MREIPEERWQDLERRAEQDRFLEEPALAYAAPLLDWIASAAALRPKASDSLLPSPRKPRGHNESAKS